MSVDLRTVLTTSARMIASTIGIVAGLGCVFSLYHSRRAAPAERNTAQTTEARASTYVPS